MNLESRIVQPSDKDILRYGMTEGFSCAPPAGAGARLQGPSTLFSPAQVPGMTLWVEGNKGLPAVGSFISDWFDQSGNNRKLESSGVGAGRQPVVASIGGKTVVDMTAAFVGTGGWLEVLEPGGGSTVWNQLVTAGAFSMFGVFRYTGGLAYANNITGPCLIIDPSNDDIAIRVGTNGANLEASMYASYNVFAPSTGGPIGTFHQFYGAYQALALSSQVDSTNGIAGAATPLNPVVTFNGIFLGSSGLVNFFQGYVAEFIIYNNFVSAPNVAKIQKYFVSKWGSLGVV